MTDKKPKLARDKSNSPPLVTSKVSSLQSSSNVSASELANMHLAAENYNGKAFDKVPEKASAFGQMDLAEVKPMGSP